MPLSPSTMQALQEALWQGIAPRLKGRGRQAAVWQLGIPAAAPFLARQIRSLHQAYTRRDASFRHAENPILQQLPGYQLYFFPRNLFRVQQVIEALPWQAQAPEAVLAGLTGGGAGPRTLRLLDLGCGTGAFSVAWLAWLADLGVDLAGWRLQVSLVDQSHEMLALAEQTLRGLAARRAPGLALDVTAHAAGVEPFLAEGAVSGGYHIVGAAMMLNELNLVSSNRKTTRATRLSEPLRRLTAPGGVALFVEPGTRRGYMSLMALREHLLPWSLLYPCAHALPCPFWVGRLRNWCHAGSPLPPGFFFDGALRQHMRLPLAMQDVNWAGLAFQSTGVAPQAPEVPGQAAPPRAPFAPPRGGRIVSAPLQPRAHHMKNAPPAPPVVLECCPDGLLRERPAAPYGPHARGRAALPRSAGAAADAGAAVPGGDSAAPPIRKTAPPRKPRQSGRPGSPATSGKRPGARPAQKPGAARKGARPPARKGSA